MFDSDSTYGNYTIQQGENHSQVHRTRDITSLSKLSDDLSTVWSLNKQNFLASAQFLFNNKLIFMIFLHPWSGSWVNIVMHFVERKQITFTLNHLVQLEMDKSDVWATLPVASDTDKVLVFSSKHKMKRYEMLFFSLHVQQTYVQAAYLQGRYWNSTDLYLSRESCSFVLAVPGKCTILILHVYTKVLQGPGNKTSLHAYWVKGHAYVHKLKRQRRNDINKQWFQTSLGKYDIIEIVKTNIHLHWLTNPVLVSWDGASEFCQDYLHAHLPQFLIRVDQDEFLNILKNSDGLQLIDSIFIGIKFNSTSDIDR